MTFSCHFWHFDINADVSCSFSFKNITQKAWTNFTFTFLVHVRNTVKHGYSENAYHKFTLTAE